MCSPGRYISGDDGLPGNQDTWPPARFNGASCNHRPRLSSYRHACKMTAMQRSTRIAALLLVAAACSLICQLPLPVGAQITFSRDWSPAGKRSSSAGTSTSAAADCSALLVKHVLPQMAYVNEMCNSRSLDGASFQNRK